MRFRFSFLVLLLAVAIPATAQSAQDHAADVQTAFARAQHPKHGINASSWFAASRDYSAEHLESYTDDADLALIAKMGFDHVRLSIDPMPLAAALYGFPGPNSDFLPHLDHAVDTMLADRSEEHTSELQSLRHL